jgi:tetratricopeptide (TPR) repeat protein
MRSRLPASRMAGTRHGVNDSGARAPKFDTSRPDPELDIADTGLFDGFIAVHERVARSVAGGASDAAIWTSLGETFYGAGREDVAYHCFEKALARDAGVVAAWLQSEAILANRGRTEEALRRFDRVVALDPGHALGWWYKQSMEERLGRQAAMLDSVRRYLAVAPPEQTQLIEKARTLLKSLAP